MHPINLPGDLTPQQQIARILRVNQAGEYGAIRIYAGQLAVLKHSAVGSVLEHMHAQEQHHLNTFNQLLVQRRVRPTLLSPLWHIMGYALGYVTAKMGVEAAMACTDAVEEVIDDHYRSQQQVLEHMPQEQELTATIARFRAEELEHQAIAIEQGARQSPGYKVLSTGIKTISKMAIWLSTRI